MYFQKDPTPRQVYHRLFHRNLFLFWLWSACLCQISSENRNSQFRSWWASLPSLEEWYCFENIFVSRRGINLGNCWNWSKKKPTQEGSYCTSILLLILFNLGLFTWRWRTLGRWGNITSVSISSVYTVTPWKIKMQTIYWQKAWESGLCNIWNVRYSEKRFIQIYKALYGNAMSGRRKLTETSVI